MNSEQTCEADDDLLRMIELVDITAYIYLYFSSFTDRQDSPDNSAKPYFYLQRLVNCCKLLTTHNYVSISASSEVFNESFGIDFL